MDYGPKTASSLAGCGFRGHQGEERMVKGTAELNVKVSEGKGYLLR